MTRTEGARSIVQFVNFDELEEQARDKLGVAAFDFIAGGAGAENTIRANREAFSRIGLIPRVLTGIKHADTSIKLFGQTVSMPIYVTPMSNQGVADPTFAEVATAKGASSVGTLFVTPTGSNKPMEEVAEASASSPHWFQFYFNKDPKVNRTLLSRAEKTGHSAVVLTVDLPVLGLRERNIRNHFVFPDGLARANVPTPRSIEAMRGLEALVSGVKEDLSWDDYEWTRENTRLPVLIKGILSPEDAEEAVKRDAAGIIVSNHGGRQLDTGIGAIEMLPSIVERVQGRTMVLFDSGIRRGIDVFKALALGADAVGVGRPILFGLAVAGSDGVAAVLEHLKRELVNVMRLCGVEGVDKIKRDLVRTS